jgi:adenylate cyclase
MSGVGALLRGLFTSPSGAALAAAVVVVVGVVGLRALGHDPVVNFENASVDARFSVRGPEPVGDDIVIVTLDDESLRDEEALLSKRTGIAALVRALRAGGAKVIALDALFPDEERVLPAPLVAQIAAFTARHAPASSATNSSNSSNTDDTASNDDAVQEATALLLAVLLEEQGDEDLAAALVGGDVVLAAHAGDDAGFADGDRDLEGATYGQLVPGERMPYAAHKLLLSLPTLSAAAARVGLVTIIVDPDDRTARHLAVGRTVDNGGDPRVLVPFSVQIAAHMLGASRSAIAYDATSHVLAVGDRRFVTDDDHNLLLNHRGPRGSFRTVRARDVLRGPRGGVDVKGAAVIVAYTDLGQDTVRTPYDTQLAGAAFHVTAVSNLLRGDLLRRSPVVVDALVVLLAALASAALFSSRLPLSAAARVAGVVAVVAVVVGGAVVAFVAANVVVPVVVPVVVVAAAGAAGVVAAYGREGVLRARLRRTFAHYLSPDVIDDLLRNPSALALGGERRELTVLFSDIQGFTTLAEQMDPLALVKFLNTYFTPMTRAVLENKGMLDKYIGDAVMAVFGAPVPRATHVDDALATVLTMHARLGELQRTFPGLNIGVGLNTGEMVVGNMGSAERFDYTVAGDAVNLASRIEGLTRAYGAFCLVGERTRAQASPRFRFREIDLVRVKGKTKPAAFFELLGDDRSTVVDYVDVDAFAAGLAAYRAGDFDAARAAFVGFSAKNPHDKSAPIFLERMAALGVPPAGWDGVFDHKSKS